MTTKQKIAAGVGAVVLAAAGIGSAVALTGNSGTTHALGLAPPTDVTVCATVTAAGTTTPDQTVAGSTFPDTTVPGGTVPDTTVPGVTVPDNVASQCATMGATTTPPPTTTTTPAGIQSGASQATCAPSACADPGYVPVGANTPCQNTVHAPIDTGPGHHIVTLGAINDGVVNECRQYAYYVPTNLQGQPAALLVAGNPGVTTCGPNGNSEAAQTMQGAGVYPVAVSNRVVAIGLEQSCNPTRSTAWAHPYIDVPAPASNAPTDAPYLQAVVSDIESRFNVDPSRIYLEGSSSGGGLVNGAACDPAVSGLFRGYAPNANYMQVTGSTLPGNPGTERCGTSGGSFFYFSQNATNDQQVHFGGTCVPTHCVLSNANNMAWWSQHMGCSSTGQTSNFGSPSAPNIHTTFSGCSFGVTPAVAGDAVHGGNHGVNNTTENTYLGGTCTDCDNYYVTREAMNFFDNSEWGTAAPPVTTTTNPPPPPSGQANAWSPRLAGRVPPRLRPEPSTRRPPQADRPVSRLGAYAGRKHPSTTSVARSPSSKRRRHGCRRRAVTSSTRSTSASRARRRASVRSRMNGRNSSPHRRAPRAPRRAPELVARQPANRISYRLTLPSLMVNSKLRSRL